MHTQTTNEKALEGVVSMSLFGVPTSHPGVLSKALILLVKDYTPLYVHTRQINLNPTNQIRALKGTPVL